MQHLLFLTVLLLSLGHLAGTGLWSTTSFSSSYRYTSGLWLDEETVVLTGYANSVISAIASLAVSKDGGASFAKLTNTVTRFRDVAATAETYLS